MNDSKWLFHDLILFWSHLFTDIQTPKHLHSVIVWIQKFSFRWSIRHHASNTLHQHTFNVRKFDIFNLHQFDIFITIIYTPYDSLGFASNGRLSKIMVIQVAFEMLLKFLKSIWFSYYTWFIWNLNEICLDYSNWLTYDITCIVLFYINIPKCLATISDIMVWKLKWIYEWKS